MDILFQNKDWLVINKPTDISSQAAFAGDVAIPEWFKLHHKLDVHVFSRLDKGTSGVMVLALNKEAARRAQEIQKQGRSEKEYIFLSAADSIKAGHEKTWSTTTPISGKSAVTQFERLGTSGKYFLYRATISNGRLHQIRRHAKESEISILGDEQYRGAKFPRLCLHCKSVIWPEIQKSLTAPLPQSMGSLGDFADDPNFLVSFDRRLHFYQGLTNAFRCVHPGEIKLVECTVDYYDGWLFVWILENKLPLAEYTKQLQPYYKKISSYYQAKGAILEFQLHQQPTTPPPTKSISLGETVPDTVKIQYDKLQLHPPKNDTTSNNQLKSSTFALSKCFIQVHQHSL